MGHVHHATVLRAARREDRATFSIIGHHRERLMTQRRPNHPRLETRHLGILSLPGALLWIVTQEALRPDLLQAPEGQSIVTESRVGISQVLLLARFSAKGREERSESGRDQLLTVLCRLRRIEDRQKQRLLTRRRVGSIKVQPRLPTMLLPGRSDRWPTVFPLRHPNNRLHPPVGHRHP